MPNLIERIKLASKAAAKAFAGGGDWVSSNRPGNRGSYGGGGRRDYDWTSGTTINYAALAGDLWENSACQAVLNWIIRAWPESYPCVKKMRGGKKVIIDHPLTDILLNPNDFDDDTTLWAATVVSFWVDGNAYWRIIRTKGGQVAQFEFIPHWAVCPKKLENNNSAGPDYYEVSTKAEPVYLAPWDVVHFRFGKDPYDELKGMSPWASIIREVYTDNEAANYVATMLRNRGASWMIVSPKDKESDFEDPEGIRDTIEGKTTGDNRGRVAVLSGAVDITLPPTMKDMGVDAIRRIPETRFTATSGIPAMACGLAAGLERSTFANTEQAEGAAWNTIVAVQRMMGRQLTKQVLWEPRNFNERVNKVFAGFDYSEVRALQPDTAGEWDRIGKAFDRHLLTDDEARQEMGREAFTAQQRAQIATEIAATAPPAADDTPSTPPASAGNPTGGKAMVQETDPGVTDDD